MPEPMTGHRCATDGKFLYVFGGYDNNEFENGIWFEKQVNFENQVIRDGNLRSKDEYSFRFQGKLRHHCCYQHGWKMNLETESWTKILNHSEISPGVVNPRYVEIGAASGAFNIITQNTSNNAENVAFYVAGTNFPWQKCKSNVIAMKLDKNSDSLFAKAEFELQGGFSKMSQKSPKMAKNDQNRPFSDPKRPEMTCLDLKTTKNHVF